MRTIYLFVLAAFACWPGAAMAQSSYDVTITSATGTMQMLQGRTYRFKAFRSYAHRFGCAMDGGGSLRINVAVNQRAPAAPPPSVPDAVFNVPESFAIITIERDHPLRQRYEPISIASLKSATWAGQSFSGTVATTDGGSATVSVVANP